MIGAKLGTLALLGGLILLPGVTRAETETETETAAKAAPAYSHADHLGREKNSDCAVCHDASEEKPTLKEERCDFCHDSESALSTYSYPHRAKRLSVKLPHALHARVNDCRDCHGLIATDVQSAGKPIMPARQCLACHEKKQVSGVSRNCTKCHTGGPDTAKRPRHFLLRAPHSAHTRESCETCHADGSGEGRHGVLLGGAEHCFDCHQKRKVSALPPNCEACHDPGVKLIPGPRQLRVAFPHDAHTGQGSCARCHEDQVNPKGGHGATKGFPDACFTCHARKRVKLQPERCESCHGRGKRLDRPENHRAASWSRRHGEASTWTVDRHGEGCESCHRSDACTTCHQQKAPRSHNGLWRLRSHGRVAAWDRDSCKTCHESGQCVSCHRSTRPLNHQGIWTSLHGAVAEDRENDYCLTCHRTTYCVACHAGQTP